MLTTISQGESLRRWIFFVILLTPIFLAQFVLGVFIGRANTPTFPLILSTAVITAIGLTVVMGLNWRLGFYSIMFFILFDRLLGLGETGTLNATKLAIALTSVFLVTAILNNQLPRWWERLADPLPLFGALFILLAIWSTAYMRYPEYGTNFLIRRTNVIALMVIVMIAISDRDIFHRSILWLLLGASIIAIITTSEVFVGKSILEMAGKANDPEGKLNTLPEFAGRTRMIGPSGDPTYYGLAQSGPGILAFAMLFYFRERWKRVLLGIGFAFIVFNIIGSGSRGGALSFAVGCATVFLLCPIKHKYSKFVMTGVALGLLLFGLAISDINVAANRIAAPGEASTVVNYRVVMWIMCWEMYADHPIMGMGVNSWFTAYDWYRLSGSSGEVIRPLNSFMQMLQETGVQGAVVYTMLYVFSAFSAILAALGTKDRRLKFQATALAGTVVGFFLFAGTSNVLENELYYLVFGLCGSSYMIYRSQRSQEHLLGSDCIRSPYNQARLDRLEAEQDAMYPVGT